VVDASTGRAVLGARAREGAAEAASIAAAPPPVAAAPAAAAPPPDTDLAAVFEQRVKPQLKALAKAVFMVAQPSGLRDGALVLTFPNDGHAKRAGELRPEIERLLSLAAGRPARIIVQADPTQTAPGHGDVSSGRSGVESPPPDEDIDLVDLVDAPPEAHVSGISRIAAAFPGSELIDEQH